MAGGGANSRGWKGFVVSCARDFGDLRGSIRSRNGSSYRNADISGAVVFAPGIAFVADILSE
jgi:hypothetical protein